MWKEKHIAQMNRYVVIGYSFISLLVKSILFYRFDKHEKNAIRKKEKKKFYVIEFSPRDKLKWFRAKYNTTI